MRYVPLVAMLAGCGGAAGSTTTRTRDHAIVRLTSNVRDAQLYVDGRFVAPLDAMRGGVAVTPGPHRFELRHDAYFARYLEIVVTRGERRVLEVELAPVLP